MEGMEAKVNLESIEKDLAAGLKNAEIKNDDGINEAGSGNATKLAVSVPNLAARFLCDFKNRIAVKIITKEMDEDDRAFIQDFLKTTPEEIALYKALFDLGATELTPEEYKAFLNRWLCNPIILALEVAIEFECKRLYTMRTQLKLRKSKGAA